MKKEEEPSSALSWLASAIKKPFLSKSDDGEDKARSGKKKEGARKPFWKNSPSKLPGTIRQVRGSATATSPATPLESSSSHYRNNSANSLHDSSDDLNERHDPLAGNDVDDTAPQPDRDRGFSALNSGKDDSKQSNGKNNDDNIDDNNGSRVHVEEASSSESKEIGTAAMLPTHHNQNLSLSMSPKLALEMTNSNMAFNTSKDEMESQRMMKDEESSPRSSLESQKMRTRLNKYLELLEEENMNMDALRQLSWSGIAPQVRSIVWQILLGYLPANRKRRQPTLLKRRKEYLTYLKEYYDVGDSKRTESETDILKQIVLDVIRTCPGYSLFQVPCMQKSLEKILYIWAIRHPASGYVQGINDLATPFFVVFVSAVTGLDLGNMHQWDENTLNRITKEHFAVIEADTFWCLSKLLDGIQDHYTFAQPGIQRMVFHLQELVGRIDESLNKHLELHGVKYMEFAYRWMNCLLMRELSLPLVIRVWDTYTSEENEKGFKVFHVYTCAAFLIHWSKKLKELDFESLIVFLKNPPTDNWTEKDIETLLSQAYVYQSLFDRSPNHIYM